VANGVNAICAIGSGRAGIALSALDYDLRAVAHGVKSPNRGNQTTPFQKNMAVLIELNQNC
jgi:hypothetical protein